MISILILKFMNLIFNFIFIYMIHNFLLIYSYIPTSSKCKKNIKEEKREKDPFPWMGWEFQSTLWRVCVSNVAIISLCRCKRETRVALHASCFMIDQHLHTTHHLNFLLTFSFFSFDEDQCWHILKHNK